MTNADKPISSDSSLSDAQLSLREHVAAILQTRPLLSLEKFTAMSSDLQQKTLYDLQINQVELEIQNKYFFRTQLDLQQITERFELAIAGTSDGLWDWNILTNEVFYSPRHKALLGYGDDDPSFAPNLDAFWQRIHPDDLVSTELAVAKAIENNQPYRATYRLQTKAGDWCWFEARGGILRDSNGRATRMSGAITDITQRRQAESDLRQSEMRFKTIFAAEPECVKVVGSNGKLLEMNAAGLAMLEAASVDEVNNHPLGLVAVILPEYRTDFYALFKSAINGQSGLLEFEIVGLRGTRRWFETHAAPLPNADGSITTMLGVTRDITETKLAQLALQTNLEEKIGLLNEVHHRVKNNLQVMSSLLRLEAGRTAQSETKSMLLDMQGRIRSMSLLHESLYRTGIFASVDLGAYIKQLATQVFRLMNTHNGAISLELDLVTIDVGIDQATSCGLLINELISNSLKHGFSADHGGEVRVELRVLNGAIQLCVSDTGIGLPDDFDLQQSHSLGLQLVSDLVKQLDGQMTIQPNAGFFITFLIADQKSQISFEPPVVL